MRLFFVLIALLFQSTVWAETSRPNIVLIMSDDMGYSDLGCFGGEIRTPHLDQLANHGLRFTNFYSENMCWVSRAAMLTGINHKTSMVNGRIHRKTPTLAELLRDVGYRTCMSGKWHLAGKNYTVNPLDRGFETYYGILGGAASFFAPSHLVRERDNAEDEARQNPDYYITEAISSEAVRMIRQTPEDQPLLLNVAYTAAHWPLHAFEKDIRQYRGQYELGWDGIRTARLRQMKALGIVDPSVSLTPRHPKVPPWKDAPHKQWQQRRMEVYAAQVTVMDRGIGRIVEALRVAGRLENTLIIYMVDNGGCHVEYGPDRKGDYLPEKTRNGRPMRPGNLPDIMPGPEDTYQSYGYGWACASNTPYRMFKQFDHEGGIRTPMIAHWPSGIKGHGALVSAVSHLVDILPTVLAASGLDYPKSLIPLDGRSLVPVFSDSALRNRSQWTTEPRSLFFDHAKGRGMRHGNWKIVNKLNKSSKTDAWELYNLEQDPTEMNDLAHANGEKLDQLVSMWKAESRRHARQAKLD